MLEEKVYAEIEISNFNKSNLFKNISNVSHFLRRFNQKLSRYNLQTKKVYFLFSLERFKIIDILKLDVVAYENNIDGFIKEIQTVINKDYTTISVKISPIVKAVKC
jgi:hypothetical protein